MRRPCVLLLASLAACAVPEEARSQDQKEGVWISRAEVLQLPDHGAAWDALRAAARGPLPPADLSDRESDCDVLVLARALVHVRRAEAGPREEVLRAITSVMGTEADGDVLALSRNLPGYVIAADLVGLPPDLDRAFRKWLRDLPDRRLKGQSMRSVHERRPNNWGTHAGAARAVIARYLGDDKDLARVAKIFRGWLGERDSYSGFEFGDLDWQDDPDHPVGVNRAGAKRDGHSIDGVLADDQRRSGGFRWPPPKENYTYEALQGALLQAMVLARAGYDPWKWGDRALLRAALWLDHVASYPAAGDDGWQPWVINHYYGADLPASATARPGKSVGWTAWTLGKRSRSGRRRRSNRHAVAITASRGRLRTFSSRRFTSGRATA